MARIDIEPRDWFVCKESLWQSRGSLQRRIHWQGLGCWSSELVGTKNVSRADALSAIRAMGHEVVEVTPEPAPVRITHGVENVNNPGVIFYSGTKEACERQSKSCSSYRVVPITF